MNPRRGFLNRKYAYMKLIQYLKDVKGELKHVSWPTRSQALALTIVVVGISVLTATVLGLFDSALSYALSFIIV